MDFYKDRVGDPKYRRYVSKQYAPFIDAIMCELAPGDVALEVGCGLGTITHLLSAQHTYRVHLAMDLCQQMVAVAQDTLGARARVFHADMRTCDWLKADVIHGHGVLEHLNDFDIYRTLEAHRRSGAKVAIHYVPGVGHGKPSFGDERLMPLSWWADKWDTDTALTFNDGKDYVLLWRF